MHKAKLLSLTLIMPVIALISIALNKDLKSKIQG
jgi:hypothetical protein